MNFSHNIFDITMDNRARELDQWARETININKRKDTEMTLNNANPPHGRVTSKFFGKKSKKNKKYHKMKAGTYAGRER